MTGCTMIMGIFACSCGVPHVVIPYEYVTGPNIFFELELSLNFRTTVKPAMLLNSTCQSCDQPAVGLCDVSSCLPWALPSLRALLYPPIWSDRWSTSPGRAYVRFGSIFIGQLTGHRFSLSKLI